MSCLGSYVTWNALDVSGAMSYDVGVTEKGESGATVHTNLNQVKEKKCLFISVKKSLKNKNKTTDKMTMTDDWMNDYLSFLLVWLLMVTNLTKEDENNEEDIILWLNSSSLGSMVTCGNGEGFKARLSMCPMTIWSNFSVGVAEMTAARFEFWFVWWKMTQRQSQRVNITVYTSPSPK